MAVMFFPILGYEVCCENGELVEVCCGLVSRTFKKGCVVFCEATPLVVSCGLVASTFEKFAVGVEN